MVQNGQKSGQGSIEGILGGIDPFEIEDNEINWN